VRWRKCTQRNSGNGLHAKAQGRKGTAEKGCTICEGLHPSQGYVAPIGLRGGVNATELVQAVGLHTEAQRKMRDSLGFSRKGARTQRDSGKRLHTEAQRKMRDSLGFSGRVARTQRGCGKRLHNLRRASPLAGICRPCVIAERNELPSVGTGLRGGGCGMVGKMLTIEKKWCWGKYFVKSAVIPI